MDYNHIEQFLDKFKKLLSKSEAVTGVIADIVSKHTNTTVDPKMIVIKGTVIHMQGSPMLRNEVFLHTQEIIAELAVIIPDRHFTAIR